MKDKQVAVVYGENGCELLAEIKVVSQQEHHKLANEYEKNKSKKQKKENDIDNHLAIHDKDIGHLYNKDFILAKAIYDRGVDRGYIDENKEFDKAYYDFILEEKPIDSKLFPNEFKKILERVEKL